MLLTGSRLRCTWCHVAVPHGWRNKALLVNLSMDPEAAGLPTVKVGSQDHVVTPVDRGPYYQKAYLGANPGGINWKSSGEWTAPDCGGGCSLGWMNRFCTAPQ